jgi:hypothetical protein
VVCGKGVGTVENAMGTSDLIAILEKERSAIVFTTSDWVKALEGDKRITTELVGSQNKAMAFRVKLKN